MSRPIDQIIARVSAELLVPMNDIQGVPDGRRKTERVERAKALAIALCVNGAKLPLSALGQTRFGWTHHTGVIRAAERRGAADPLYPLLLRQYLEASA